MSSNDPRKRRRVETMRRFLLSGETKSMAVHWLQALTPAALRAIRRIASARLLACWSVRCRLGIGGSGGKSACGASCGGGGMVRGEKAGGGAGHGGADVSGCEGLAGGCGDYIDLVELGRVGWMVH